MLTQYYDKSQEYIGQSQQTKHLLCIQFSYCKVQAHKHAYNFTSV